MITPRSDQELVKRARTGDITAFGELWARYERRVLALCRHYLRGAHRDVATGAHDLATDTFIRALHCLDRYQDRTSEGVGFDAWLLEIARRICRRCLEKQRRRQQWACALAPEQDLIVSPTQAPRRSRSCRSGSCCGALRRR